MRLLVSSAVLALAGPCVAHAAAVYPGCAVPAAKPGHHTFYIDPAKGSPNGDGSAAKPWRTLAEVLDPARKLIASKAHNVRTFAKGDTALIDVDPGAPVKAGDTLMLMSGNHGNPRILNLYNQDFISIVAAPGQTPVVDGLSVLSAGKWLLQGIKVQGASPAAVPNPLGAKVVDTLVNIGRGQWLGTTSDIVFTDSSVSTTDNTSAWSATDWIVKPYYFGMFVAQGSSCTALINNHFYNLFNAVGLSGENSLFDHNVIEYMSNDGIDVTSSGVQITHNLIKNGNNVLAVDPLHADGIQGWSLSTNGIVNVNRNVLIDSNTIIKTGNPDLTTMQGIGVFDGKWDGLTISNNVVTTNHWHGIAVFGAQNSRIVNNTVISSAPETRPTWILTQPSKDGLQNSNGTIIRNNISNQLVVTGSGVTADHNIAAAKITMPVAGKATWVTSGTIGSANSVVPSILTQFQSNNPKADAFDFRLRNGSTALGYGAAVGAPTVDIVGAARKPTVSAGAYNQ